MSLPLPTGFRYVWPTAVHDVALKQLTPSSAPPKPVDGFGAGLMVKAEPVQSATRLSLEAVMEPPELLPTAAQKLTPAHETELNSLDGPGGSFGLATTVHVVPFHISARVWVSPLSGTRPPCRRRCSGTTPR